MADVTFGVKMPEELKKQIEDLMKDAGLRTNKDFMQSLVNSYILEKTKESIPEVAEDLKELQIITQRTNDIYLNLGYRIENINKANQKESQEQLSKKDTIILEFQDKIEMLNLKNSKIQESNDIIVNQNSDQLQRVNELTESNDNIKALIEEYKNKNDMLLGDLGEYKKFKAELEEYKKLLADSQARIIDKDNIIKDREYTINQLNESSEKIAQENQKEIDTLKKENQKDVNQLNEKIERIKQDKLKDAETLKKENLLSVKLAVAEVKEELNNKSSQDQLKHNKEIEEYQNKYKALLEELDKKRTTPKTTPKTNSKEKKSATVVSKIIK